MQIQLSTRPLITIGCIILVIAIASCTAKKDDGKTAQGDDTKAATGQPKISAVEQEIDFGQVKQGSIVEKVFVIKNTGDADLKIEKARGS